jgi:hypothetical protein
MKHAIRLSLLALLFATSLQAQTQVERTISYREYLDKVHGGWVGKAVGLVLGVPKEYAEPWPPSDFDYYAQLPTHFSDRASGDDIYLPLAIQLALKTYGVHATPEQYMKEWSVRLFSGRAWVSCETALELYYAGIVPPQTGQLGYNRFWDDMYSQISLDSIGWSAPGLINTAAEMADPVCHIANWGVGADGGIFTAALMSEAFFTSDPEELIRRARAVLPAGSRYGELVDDALRLRKEQSDWRMTRKILAKKYNVDLKLPDYHVLPATGIGNLIGLLYGDGDFGKSMTIAQKNRWDSDCTAATVAGVIGTMVGYSRIDRRWTLPLHDTYENYCVRGLPRWLTFTDIAKDTVEIGEEVIKENGGRVTGSGENRVYVIPRQKPCPLARQENATPELIAQGDHEVAQYLREKLKGMAEAWDSQWTLTMASLETKPEVLESYMTRTRVLKVQPGSRGAVLERTITLAPNKHHYLKVGVAHHPKVFCEATGQPEAGSWNLEVHVDGKKIGDYAVRTHDGTVVWEDPQFDLTPYAGKTVKLTLIARQGTFEFYRSSTASYWSGITVISLDQPEPWR